MHRTPLLNPIRTPLLPSLVLGLSLAGLPLPGATSADGAWSRLTDPATPPLRWMHASIHDPIRDRILIVGGTRGEPYNGIQALSLSPDPQWSRLTPANAGPLPYDGQQAIYDPVRDQMVVVGGNFNNDVWKLPLSGALVWSQIVPSGTLPPNRASATVTYDPVRDRLILFGGFFYTGTYTYLNDVWALSLSNPTAWTPLAPLGTAPAPRAGHCAVYDAVRDRIIVFGGEASPFHNAYIGDAWALSLGGTPAWSPLAQSGSHPVARSHAGLTYDPPRDRIVLYGGVTGTPAPNFQPVLLGDAWELPLTGAQEWAPLSVANAPPPREAFSVAHDVARNRVVIHGGGIDGGTEEAAFALDLGAAAWSRVEPSAPPAAPEPRAGACVAFDSYRQRVIFHGGSLRPGDVPTWAFYPATRTWTPILAAGPAPSAGSDRSAIYDPVGDRMVIVGPQGTWSLSFTPSPVWTQLPPGPTSPLRDRAVAAYDPVRRRMIVCGGYQTGISDGSYSLREVWALSLSGTPAWTSLAQHPSTAGIFGHSMVYDPVRDRVLTIGGSTKESGTVIVRSLGHRIFALPLADGGEWNEISSTGTAPQQAFNTVYDSNGDRLIMLGGVPSIGAPAVNTVWARSAADDGVWNELSLAGTPPRIQSVPAAFDRIRNQVCLMLAAQDPAAEDVDQVWALELGAIVGVPHAGERVLALAQPWPNPAGDVGRISFSLPDHAPAHLEMLDVAGRLVWERNVGALGPGPHVVEVGDVASRASGIYFVRLVRAEQSLVRKLIIAR